MSQKQIGIFCAVASSVLSSLAWIFQGEAVHRLTPMVVAAGQGLMTGVVYLVHLRISGQQFPHAAVRTHARKLTEYILLRRVIGGILVCYALLMSESIKVMFLTKLEPYLILFWVWLLQGKTIPRPHAILLAVHITGAILLSTGGSFTPSKLDPGDFLLIAAIALFAYCYLHAEHLSHELGAAHLNGVSSIAAWIILLPIAVVLAPTAAWNPISIGWLNLLIVVLLFDVIAVTLWYHSMRSLEGWVVSALRAVGPVLAAPFAWLFFNQSLNQMQILGAALVLITSALLTYSKAKSA
jgi:drug/metabolite transporter (DMT)-like permease